MKIVAILGTETVNSDQYLLATGIREEDGWFIAAIKKSENGDVESFRPNSESPGFESACYGGTPDPNLRENLKNIAQYLVSRKIDFVPLDLDFREIYQEARKEKERKDAKVRQEQEAKEAAEAFYRSEIDRANSLGWVNRRIRVPMGNEIPLKIASVLPKIGLAVVTFQKDKTRIFNLTHVASGKQIGPIRSSSQEARLDTLYLLGRKWDGWERGEEELSKDSAARSAVIEVLSRKEGETLSQIEA